MPCNCDHLEPNLHEIESKNICEHLVWLAKAKGQIPTMWISKGAENQYGVPQKVEELTQLLCKSCENTPEEVIYNGRIMEARALADWWDNHKEADKVRLEKERQHTKMQEIARVAMSLLTPGQTKALKEYWGCK